MRDTKLLDELLNAHTEDEVLDLLEKRELLEDNSRWKFLGNIPNNESIVRVQQSNSSAALVEKCTNAIDALLLRGCKALGINPRGKAAPKSMSAAVQEFFGNVGGMEDSERRAFAEENLVLFATGEKMKPSISVYDNGEGQLPEDFPKTFCSLIYGTETDGSYKGAVPFVQGRFNMGGTGVLPFCSEKRKLQLIVSRVPSDVAGRDDHEWAYTIMCFFPSQTHPSWKYLVAKDGSILTAGADPLGLVPRKNAKSGQICSPRERKVASGTLIKMYELQVPPSNICGDLFRKLGEYLIQPALPLRIIECRPERKANVTGVNLWDRLAGLLKNVELEEGCEDGVGLALTLSTGETISGQIRVFKMSTKKKGGGGDDLPVGLRALVNGQSHARRGADLFATKKIDKEHIAPSMLVILDCTSLGQQSKNALFQANREHFFESTLRKEVFQKLEDELGSHELLIKLNDKRYKEKVENAVSDEDGIKAMEDLLAEDPTLAELFGGVATGSTTRGDPDAAGDEDEVEEPKEFVGVDYPTFIHRKDGSMEVQIEVPRGGVARTSFLTDVRNNYFTRTQGRGKCAITGDLAPSFRLYNGRLTFTCRPPKSATVGSQLYAVAMISDSKGSGPFELKITAKVVAPRAKKKGKKHDPPPPKSKQKPSRPNILEVHKGSDVAAIAINKNPAAKLEILVNMDSADLETAKARRAPEEAVAVEFVFKYGLALLAMSMLEKKRGMPEWENEDAKCRSEIGDDVSSMARVIVSLCLNLPKKLPKMN